MDKKEKITIYSMYFAVKQKLKIMINQKTLWSIAVFLLFTFMVNAQNLVGTYKTIDDASGEAKSHISIYEENGKFYGKVIKLLPKATVTVCSDCPGDRKGKNIEGMIVLWDLKPYKDYWSYGQIIDPATGKIYKASVWLENGNVQVRGYIGFSLLGRTQTWVRLKE